jgi:hypothetical protein
MEASGFQFGRRVEDQVDLLRALVAQGKVEPETAKVCFDELAERARAARRVAWPRRRWTDRTAERASPDRAVGPEARPRRPRRFGRGRRLDPERRRRLVEHIAATALPVRFAGVLGALQGVGEVPLVVVDAERQPEVADLPRVFRAEDIPAEARSRWLFVDGAGGRGCAVLLVGVSRPVRCRFRLLFSLVHDRALLTLVGRAGGFVMTCVDPAVDRDRAIFEAMYVAVPPEVLSLLGLGPRGSAKRQPDHNRSAAAVGGE